MEHACQHCGTEVEDGRPFCPQCRAPQINVLVAAPDAGVGGELNTSEPNAMGDAVSAELHSAPNFDRAGAMDSRVAARSAISAGLLGVFIGVIPILGIVWNFAMMYSLGSDNWIRLIVWLLIGQVIYFAYSRSHSRLQGAPAYRK